MSLAQLLYKLANLLDRNRREIEDRLDLSTLVLQPGSHATREEGVSLMEAVAWSAGLPHSNWPEPIDRTIAAYARVLNDNMPDYQRQRLVAYIPRLTGATYRRSPEKRAFLCADYAVRKLVPAALRFTGPIEAATKLERLQPIVDIVTARSASTAVNTTATLSHGQPLTEDEVAVKMAVRAASESSGKAWVAASELAHISAYYTGHRADFSSFFVYRVEAAATSASLNAGFGVMWAAVVVGDKAWDMALELLDGLLTW